MQVTTSQNNIANITPPTTPCIAPKTTPNNMSSVVIRQPRCLLFQPRHLPRRLPFQPRRLLLQPRRLLQPRHMLLLPHCLLPYIACCSYLPAIPTPPATSTLPATLTLPATTTPHLDKLLQIINELRDNQMMDIDDMSNIR
ncbi:8260_t:CDS:2 [Dentiscutata erythropus]|uniref:8260_t:CDS:1 n=1 Tax=Dentiscutata erythropus TaxID=1348616 RepID=A0A9N9C578_9GLOM|nr:8260_t:CDS:2 [Dentiscutata erythropus]